MDEFNHKVNVIREVMEQECSEMLSDFFKDLREQKKKKGKVAKDRK